MDEQDAHCHCEARRHPPVSPVERIVRRELPPSLFVPESGDAADDKQNKGADDGVCARADHNAGQQTNGGLQDNPVEYGEAEETGRGEVTRHRV